MQQGLLAQVQVPAQVLALAAEEEEAVAVAVAAAQGSVLEFSSVVVVQEAQLALELVQPYC